MACVTLKRPLDFDPLEALHSPNRQPKRRRCTPIKKIESRDGLESSFRNPNLPGVGMVAAGPSVFKESPLSPSEVANNLRDELKRMKRRRQIVPYESRTSPSSSPIHSAPESPEPMESAATAIAMAAAAAGSSSSSSTNSSVMPSAKALMGTKEKPVFTLKQMTMICERMCKERTDQVRQEYDKILQQKLSEQYDAFVKFIDHQIQQRFNQSQLPSYLS